jgi:hypothetical protein
MGDEELDLSAYDAAVVEHALYGLARARLFDGVARGRSWDADLGAGRLTIGARRYQAQIIGTFARGSRTFLWAWANPGASGWGPSLRAANELRALAQRRGHAVFDQRSVADGWVNARELAYVSGELAGGHPIYAAEAGAATVFLLVTDAEVDPIDMSVALFPDLFLDFQSFAMVDLSACVARFLERVGFEVMGTDAATHGFRERDGASVTIDWRGDGHVAGVRITTGRARTG